MLPSFCPHCGKPADITTLTSYVYFLQCPDCGYECVTSKATPRWKEILGISQLKTEKKTKG